MTSTAGPGSAERPDGGAFAVELPVFTGPFRVLADLILEQKIDVCDVSIAKVTDGFLAHSKEAESWSLEEATWFLAVCAIMLELKVGRLMPRHEVVDEEDLLGVSPKLAAGGVPAVAEAALGREPRLARPDLLGRIRLGSRRFRPGL